MNAFNMHISWRELLDRSGALDSADFEAEQIDFWLNQAQRQFVKDRYDPIGKGFERTEKRTADLEYIVARTSIDAVDRTSDTTGSYKPNCFSASLPDNHWLTVGEEVSISFSDCHGVSSSLRTQVTQVTDDTYSPMIDNAFSEHVLDNGRANPLRLRKQKEVELITDGNYDVTTYYLTYLREPVEISYDPSDPSSSVDCELADHTHDEIVRMAVRMTLASLSDTERYNLESAEESKQAK